MSDTGTNTAAVRFQSVAGGVTAPAGFRAAGVHAQLKKVKKDMAVLISDVPATAAGTFTTNQVKAAPLIVSQQHVRSGPVRAVIINSGNANACTGEQGLADARAMAARTGQHLGVAAEQVLVASTGVIGQPLPMSKVTAGIDMVVAQADKDGWLAASEAIMTTDTRTKNCAVSLQVQGKTAHIGGMAKGSGMIHPNMATMLAFVTTDLAVAPDYLQRVLTNTVARTFNMITVDGDTSTNDMMLVLANGLAGNTPLTGGDADSATFEAALEHVALQLAKEVARDGEGATKLIQITVQGVETEAAAAQIARSVASSNLVKTAMFGEDANWGRILCAAGYSGVVFHPEQVDIYIGDVCVARQGAGLPFDEAAAKRVLQQDEVRITLQFAQGEATATAWTCDMSYDYVKINASYRS